MNSNDKHSTDVSAGQRSHSPPPNRESIPVDVLDATEALEYDAETGRYRANYDLSYDSPSDVVIHTVAAVSKTAPTDLEALYSVIDPDALNSLFTSLTHRRHEGDARVTFAFHGHTVVLNSYGVVEIEPTRQDLESN